MLLERDKEAALLARELRRRRHAQTTPVDNSALPAGSPLFFKCESCFGQIIVAEDYLTPQSLCYDCRDLRDRGWI